MFKHCFLILLALSICPGANAVTIRGSLPNHANRSVTVYKYVNFVSDITQLLGYANTDAKGNFEINVPLPRTTRLKVTTENTTIRSFNATDKEVYTISENGNEFTIEDESGFMKTTAQLSEDLASWRSTWTDKATGKFLKTDDPLLVLSALDSIKARYMPEPGSPFYKNLLYTFANQQLMFITRSYIKTDKASAIAAMDQAELEHITNRETDLNNPAYIAFLELYMRQRLNIAPFARVPEKTKDMIKRVVEEASFVKNDSAQALLKVIGINILYELKWYGDGQSKQAFNKRVGQEFTKTSAFFARQYLSQVILKNNSVNIGDHFPELTLPNEQGQPTSITTITTPFILIDFWATWCGPCKEDMKKMPALAEKYKDLLTIVTISADEKPELMKTYLDAQGYTGKWVQLYNGSKDNYLNKLKIDAYPTFFILNDKKEVIAMPKFNEVFGDLEKILKRSKSKPTATKKN